MAHDDDLEPGQKKKSDNTLVIVLVVCACLFGFCVIIPIIAAIAIPNLLVARKGANEAAAIGAMRTLTTAQALYREGDKDKDGVLDYASSLGELGTATSGGGMPLLDPELASGTKRGYVFRTRTREDPRFTWEATASPAAPGKSGDRYFFVDESGVIRFSIKGEATAQDTSIGG